MCVKSNEPSPPSVVRRPDKGQVDNLAAEIGMVRILDWDTAFFGFSVAQITHERITMAEMAEVLGFCRDHRVRLLQFKCDAHDRDSILLAEASGFHFADMRMIMDRQLAQRCEVPKADGVVFRVAEPADVPAMMDIAENLYIHSRYYFDKNFPRQRVHDFYRDWVRKAVFGEFDDVAWILCEKSNPMAFCTARINGPDATIGLVGLHPDFAGRGLGHAVVTGGLAVMFARGVDRVTVTTQGRNYPAQRLYQRAGFVISKAQIYYHYWNEGEDA